MKERWRSATPFFQKERCGSATPFFDKERERSGTPKKWERLTHCKKCLWYLGKWHQNFIGNYTLTLFLSLILPFSPSTLASMYTSWLISFSHNLSFSALEGHITTKRPQMIKRHRRSNIRTVLCSLSYEPLSNTSADCQANMCYRT